MKLTRTTITLFGFLLSASDLYARPLAATDNRRVVDQPPKLSDTLAVAKSPLEPVTLTPNLPGARNDGQPNEAETTKSLALAEISPSTQIAATYQEQKQTTYSEESDEQQQSSSSTKGLDESVGLQDHTASDSTRSVSTELPEASESTKTNEATTTDASVEMGTKSSDGESDEAATTLSPTTTSETPTELSSTPTSTPEPTTTETITTPSPTTTSTTTTPTTASPDTKDADSDYAELTTITAATTIAAAPTTTTRVPTESVGTPEEDVSTTNPPTSFTSPETSTASSSVTSEEGEQQAFTTAVPTSTTASESLTTIREEPTVLTTSTTTTPPQPTTTTTNSPTPATHHSKEDGQNSTCNHLPTYNNDEIQKVFREETTFKNGTIKGKFTYINFDQRYRLVHYTRLPYGPVKIDMVEELSRPKQGDGTQASTPTLNEVPNAVLQLRNLLPNSLFGFPFLGPNSAQARPIIGPKEGDDRSNMYFYSTDSLATPNLLTPRVPVSLLPGQRINSPQTNNFPATSVLDHSYLEQSLSPVNKVNDLQSTPRIFGLPSSNGPKASDNPENINSEVPNNSQQSGDQFHYANLAGLPESKSFVYSHFGSGAQPVLYQYAPLSPLAFQPMQLRPYYQPQPPVGSQSLIQTTSDTLPHQAHQPHSHEHHMSQYMLAPAVSKSESAQDSARLRLRVKTSKALNVNRETGTKSAQLRLQPSDGHYSAPATSPMHSVHHKNHQRRLGKQNLQLKSSPTNYSPVVYHVLRNPAGRVFGQFNQGYAVAYDHDN